MTKPKPIRTDSVDVEVEVIGRVPENTPYLRIADRDGYVASIDGRELRRLADQIYSALQVASR